uniref:Uncharacterized protein n=1 Tax=Vibrio owensii TaxID=696485 RepID=A0A1S6KSM1_9VIBR|nr:hypothetical protein [Vibrio owensii]
MPWRELLKIDGYCTCVMPNGLRVMHFYYPLNIIITMRIMHKSLIYKDKSVSFNAVI